MMDAQKALSYAEGFVTALAAVLQDRERVDGKVGSIAMTTAEVKKLLRDVTTHTGCDESELRNLREENSLLTAMIKELREASKPVCASNKDDQKCEYYHEQDERAECWGTRERSLCTCGGDKGKCDFPYTEDDGK